VCIDDHRRRVPGARPAQRPRPARRVAVDRLDAREHRGGEVPHRQALHRLVEPLEHVRRRAVRGERHAAQEVAHLGHHRGRPPVVARHVAHDDHQRAVGQQERVEPIAADLGEPRGGPVAHRDLDTLGLAGLGEQAALEREREVALGLERGDPRQGVAQRGRGEPQEARYAGRARGGR
jgi:hypothetical protein